MRFTSLSDIGLIRKKNQDSYVCVYNDNDDVLFLICDGIGGAKAGEVASFEIVKYFSEIFSENKGFKDEQEAITYLKYHTKIASNKVYELSLTNKSYEGMGTTIAGLLISSVGNFVINAGDSRVYGMKNGKLIQLSQDHTLVNELIQRKVITEDEAKVHPKRHYLTRFLGVFEDASADVYAISDLNDYYLLSSDGLHGYVPIEQMQNIISDKSFSLSQRAQFLLKSALAKGGYDNITLILVDMEEDTHE